MTIDKYSHLRQLLGGYFHQDWALEYSSPIEALKAFKEEEPLEVVEGVCKEMDEVIPLIEQMQDPDEYLLKTLWCYYSPKSDGLTAVAWLRNVRVTLCES